MRIDILTLFPEMFAGVLGSSILKRAAMDVVDPRKKHLDADEAAALADRAPVVSYHLHQMRDWSDDARHRKVDDAPFGGGPGMVMRCQPIWDAVCAVTAMDPAPPLRILTTPQGVPLTQPLVEQLAQAPRLMILCGHYEGLDQRVIDRLHDELPGAGRGLAPAAPHDSGGAAGASPRAATTGGLMEISLGDYVLSGGELAAMVLIDAVVRLLPGALGHAESAHRDSFSPGVRRLLDHPHYTKPREWEGRVVPEVLLGGNHAKIEAWRVEQSREATRQRRPDLLK